MIKDPIRTSATKAAFAEAFCQLSKHKPLAKITIHELSNKAGYNRSTFYQYFRDTYDLLEFIENNLIEQIKGVLAANLREHSLADSFIMAFTKVHHENAIYYNALLQAEYFTSFIVRFKQEILPLLAEKLVINSDDKKALYALDFRLSGMIAVISRWLQNGRDMPAEELAELICKLFNN